jgi:hypothetical protein
MPTGYTADIEKGITFQQFAMNCAHAFGALITMRDEPIDSPIPEFKVEQYHYDWIERAKADLAKIEAMTKEDCRAAAKKEYDDALAYQVESKKEREDLRQKYESMLVEARAWVPPSPEHEGLKKFMIEQIEQSIEWDCADYERDVPKLVPADQWHLGALAAARETVARYEKSLAEEIERVNKRNLWVRQLKESLTA